MPWTFPVGSMLGDNRSLVLRVHLPKAGITKTTAFDAQMTVGQACERIRAQLRESDQTADGFKDYGLFLPHEDNKKGLWLDNSRTLEHYILRNGDTVEYRYRYRWLYIRTMDGTRKTLKVDDSKTVAELMLLICTKMGIYNYEEYLLAKDRDELDRGQTGTLKRGTISHTGIHDKMEKLKRKLHTDDDVDWLNPSQSLRQQGVDEKEVLLLKRRYFFSDMNVDARDPVQLNLLYVQLKDAILKGTHPVSLEEAIYLASIQCQVEFGNYVAEKFKPNFLDLKDFLPKEYAKIRSLEKKIFQQHAELHGLTDVEAKVKYCQFCRSLKTYGITFFLVKERIKGKNKLIPRLLGITKDSVIRLDEKTKEVLKIWPLTSISKWAASPHAFTMDFGEYSPDEYYTAQTSEGEQISQLIAGYIDIILKKQKASDHPGLLGDEESAMYEENVQAERATIIQHNRLPPNRTRLKDGVVNGLVEQPVVNQRTVYNQRSQMNGWSQQSNSQQYNTGFDDTSVAMVDAQSAVTGATLIGRPPSPDNFMTGGTHIFHYQELSSAQRALLTTITEDVETLQAAKDQLDIGPANERVLYGVGTDDASKRWLNESMGASQAKVTDEVGAMNAAVAQALRSANRAESHEIHTQHGMEQYKDPGDDLMMMQQSFRVVTIHFPAFVDDVKRVAILRRESGALHADQTGDIAMANQSEESTQNLLSAARYVADAFTDLLESARPLAMGQTHDEIIQTTEETNTYATSTPGPVSSSSRKAIMEAASKVGEASHDLLRHVMDSGTHTDLQSTTNYTLLTEEEHLYQDQLLSLAKAVANATATLVIKAKNLATQPSLDPEVQQRVIAAATQTGLCTSQLVACTKVLAPTITQATCQQQLVGASHEVSWAVDSVVQATRAAYLVNQSMNEHQIDSIRTAGNETEIAATEVRDKLDQLNAHLLKGSVKAYQNDVLDTFQIAYEDLNQHYTNDGQRMIASARRLAQATAQMISNIKAEAEASSDNTERQTHLFAAAKQLADATTNLITAAKACSSDPNNLKLQTELRDYGNDLNSIVYSIMGELFQSKLVHNLQIALRSTITSATQLVNISQVSSKYSRGNSFQLLSDTKHITSLIPKTMNSINESRLQPDDPMTQLELISSAEKFTQPCTSVIRSSKSLAPTLTEPIIQSALDNSTTQLANSLEILRACLARARPLVKNLQLDGALVRLGRLSEEVATIETSLLQGKLISLPDEKIEDCYHLLSSSVHDGQFTAKEIEGIIKSLAGFRDINTQKSQINKNAGQAAILFATHLSGIVQATRGIIADQLNPLVPIPISKPHTQQNNQMMELNHRQVFHKTGQSVQLAYELVQALKDAQLANDTSQPAHSQTILSHSEQLTKQLINSLSDCLNCLPGLREIAEASNLIEQKRTYLTQLNLTPVLIDSTEYQLKQNGLTQAAVEFNQATGDLLSSYSPGTFRNATRHFTGAYDHLIDQGIELAASNDRSQQTEPSINQELINGLINVSDRSSAVIDNAHNVCSQPDQSDLRVKFQQAARGVTDSINQLLTSCTSGVSLDRRECEIALRRLEAACPLLENPNRPLNHHCYYDCVDAVAKSLTPLADSLRQMSISAKELKTEEFNHAVRQCADSMCELVEETAQAAYLIGTTDSQSPLAHAGRLDSNHFIQLQKQIQHHCDALCNPSITNQEVITISTEMARNAKFLFESCNNISENLKNLETRQQLQSLLKQTMQSITSLIQYATNEIGKPKTNHQLTLMNTQIVNMNMHKLINLITCDPNFKEVLLLSSSSEMRESQRPVCSAGLSSLQSAQTVLRTAQNLITNVRNGHTESGIMTFSTASKELSESMKALATAMREHAPGQKECQLVLNNITHLIHELRQARMSCMEDKLQSYRELNEEGFQRQLISNLHALLDSTPAIGTAARSQAEQLGRAVLSWDSYLPNLVQGSINAASRSSLPSTQLIYLDHACAVLEAADQLIAIAKDAGGNPRAVHLHESLNESIRGVLDSCEDYIAILDDIASRQGHVSTLIDTLNRAQILTDELIQVPTDARFSDYQTRLLCIARHMEQLNQTIQLRARQLSTDGEIAPLAHTLTQEYQEMCQTCKGAAATLPDMHEADQLRAAVRSIGAACVGLVQATEARRPRGSELHGPATQQFLLSHNKNIAELDKRADILDSKLRHLIALLDTQGPGTLACLQSANTVSGIIADLDTTIMFASSGTLHQPVRDDIDALMTDDDYIHALGSRPGYALSNHSDMLVGSSRGSSRPDLHGTEHFTPIRESIVRTARALVDDTQSLVSGTGEDQTRLVNTTHVAVERITQLADVVKRGAAVIGPGQPDTQVELLSSCREVAVGLQNVFQSASQVQDRSPLDPVYDEVRTNAQSTISSVGRLIQTLKSIEDDERLSLRALENVARYCREQASQLESGADLDLATTPTSSRKSVVPSISSAISGSSSLIARYLAPDDLARLAGNSVQSVVSKVILTSNTQNQRDIQQTASITRDLVTYMAVACKNLIRYADTSTDTRKKCAQLTKQLIEEFATLLDALKAVLLSTEKKDVNGAIGNSARHVADLSHNLLTLLESLREGPRLVMYFRASSPEWRDVAEKYIGRHVAYHHHYVPNYTATTSEPTHRSVYIRPTCYPLQFYYDVSTEEDRFNDEAESRIMASINQLDASIKQCSADNRLAQSLLTLARNVAVSIQDLIRTARSVVAVPSSEAVDRARRAESKGKKNANTVTLWRTELNVSVATQHMCQLSHMCSEALPSWKPNANDPFSSSGRLILSRERLLAAVRQVAAAGAQLLLAAKTRKATLVSSDLHRLKDAGLAVKRSTDLLVNAMQRGDFINQSNDGEPLTSTDITWPTYINKSLLQGIHTRAQIQSQQAQLDALERQLAQMQPLQDSATTG